MDMDDPALTAWLAVARCAHFAACLLVGGVWAFDRWVGAAVRPRWRRIAVGLLWTATPAVLVSGAAWLWLVVAEMSGLPVTQALRPAVLATVWLRTQFGRAWQAHAVAWAVGAVAAVVWTATRRGAWVGLVAAATLVGGLAWAGHGGTGPAPAWHRAADVLHLLASAVWPAGLVPFALVVGTVARSDAQDRWHDVARLTRRFSSASLTAVAVLTATGLFNSYCLLGSPRALLTTPYGRVLTAKLVLFATLVGLGAANRLVLAPRLTRDGPAATRHLRRNVIVEVILGTGVVAAIALLGLLEPARTGVR